MISIDPRRRTRRSTALLGVFALAIIVAVPNFANAARGPGVAASGAVGVASTFGPTPSASSVPIQHIVVIMQENHAYDNFFGTYCTSTGPDCPVAADGIPNGTCEPYQPSDPSLGCVVPVPFPNATLAQPEDIGHDSNNSRAAYNDGMNNNFYDAEGTSERTFKYFDANTLPSYWDLAQQYALGDNFFSPFLSYSLSNHWAMFAGQAPNVTQYFTMYGPGILVQNTSSNHTGLYSFQEAYLNAANTTPTIADQLVQSAADGGPSPTWKYYDTAFTPGMKGYDQAIQNGTAWNYWDPSAAKAETYLNPAFNSHYVGRNDIFTDLASDSLPDLSWVLPNNSASDHPAISEVPDGEAWVTSVVNAIEESPEWNSTAIFLTWDEYGGYFDHVPPPQLDAFGLGFRVPLLVISPYTREGYVDHQFGSFEALLHLMEWRYDLPEIGLRQTAFPLPLDAFDFQQTPRAPFYFPTNASLAPAYPQSFQSSPVVGGPSGLTALSNGSGVQLSWTPPQGGGSVDSYNVQYGPASSPTEFTSTVDGAASGAQLSNLSPGTNYTFRVQAAGPDSESGWTSTVSAQAGSQGVVGWVWSVAPYLLLAAGVGVAWLAVARYRRGRKPPRPAPPVRVRPRVATAGSTRPSGSPRRAGP
jgi:phospholipase C